MNEYSVIMDEWTWSYSRIKLFQQCPYAFIQKYIYKEPGVSNFYADFGSFIHHILQLYYQGELKKDQLQIYYIEHFSEYVGRNIQPKIRSSYFVQGLEYLGGDILSPTADNIIGVEKEFIGTIGGFKMRGFADLIYRDNLGMVITDHKSKLLEPRSNGKRKKKDAELDEYLVQLYLYANFVRQTYGVQVNFLEFNCFRSGTIIREPCTMAKELDAVRWAQSSIKKIHEANEFMPNPDYFYCNNLCDLRKTCPYADCF